MALLVFVLWSWIVLWVRWDGGEPVDWLVFGKALTTPALAVPTGLALVMAMVRRFAGFLNLSTLQSFYASRLTRAYLGASNGNRFTAAADSREARQRFSVAEPAAGRRPEPQRLLRSPRAGAAAPDQRHAEPDRRSGRAARPA